MYIYTHIIHRMTWHNKPSTRKYNARCACDNLQNNICSVLIGKGLSISTVSLRLLSKYGLTIRTRMLAIRVASSTYCTQRQ